MKILFYDVVTPTPYTNQTLLETGLGGTEATITRVAHSLKEHHSIYVAQHCRDKQDDKLSDGVHYISLETANALKPDVVVLLRYYNWLEKVGKQFPNARHYFWMHNMPSKALYGVRETLVKYRYQVIAVSLFHQREIERRLHGKWYQRLMSPRFKNSIIPVHVIYNPIDDHLEPNDTPWNPNQMILASTPYKGLPITLKLFEQVQEKFPEYKLLIATYSKWDKDIKLPKHVEFIGSLLPLIIYLFLFVVPVKTRIHFSLRFRIVSRLRGNDTLINKQVRIG